MTTYDKLLNGRGLETVLRKLKTEIETPREIFVGLYNVSDGEASLESCTYSEIVEAIVSCKVVVLCPVETSEVNSIFYAYGPDNDINSSSTIFSTFPKIEGSAVIVETLTVNRNSVLYEQISTEKKIYTIDGEFSFEDSTEINTGFPQSIIQDVEEGKEVVISGTLSMIGGEPDPGPPQSANPIAKSSSQQYSNVKYVAQYVTKESKDGVTRYYFDAFNVVERYSTGDSNKQPVALQFVVQSDKNNAITCWAYELVDSLKFSALYNSVVFAEDVESLLQTGTPIAYIADKTIYAPVSEEGITTETDPIFNASPAASITATDISRWNAITTSITSTLDSRYVNITGDTMTGPLEVESDQGYGLTVKSILESDKISFWHSSAIETPAATLSIGVNPWYGGIVLGVTNSTGATGTVGISGVATPSDDYDAANKIYVDDTVYNAVDDAMSAVTTTIPKEVYAVDIEEGIESYSPVRDTYASIKEKLDAGVFVYGRTISAFEDGPLCSDIFITKYPSDSAVGQDSIEFTKFRYVEGYSASGYDEPCSIISTKFIFDEDGSFTFDHPSAVRSHVRADWAATIPTSPAFIENKPDLSTYVSKSAVISTGPTNGTAIANIGGVTIYAPVAQGGVTVESDPVFTGWATGAGVAAYTITASDVARWNAITTNIVNPVNADWNATTGLSSILNKPTIPTAASFTSTYDSRYALASHTHDYSKVTVSQTQTSGTEIGKITVNSNGSNTTTTLYAPTVNLSTYATKSYAEGLTATLVTAAVTNGLAKTSDLTSYVAKSDVIPATGVTGTAIATVGGKTIYAPVSEEGIQSETDPVFSASAAASITTGDIASWNAKSSITPIQSDWNQSSTTALDFIKNKPTISDTLVEQNPVSTSGVTYPILIKGTSGVSAATATAGFTGSIYANPGTGLLHVTTLTGSSVTAENVSAHTTTIRDQDGTVVYTIQGSVAGHGDQTNLYIKSSMHDNIITVTDYGPSSKSNISFNDNLISGITTPTSDGQPANKKYVDDAISAVTTTVLDSGVLYADITGTTSLTSNVAYANIVAATPTKAVMLRRNGDIYQLAKAASSGLEFRVIKPLEIDEIVMTSSTITYNSYLTNVSGTTLTINE